MTDLPAPLDRTKVTWSYTFLHTYEEVCPHQAYRKFIARNLLFEPKSQAQKHGQDVHKAMQNRVAAGVELPTAYRQWDKFAKPFDGKPAQAEQKLGITLEGKATGFFEPDTWGRGVIDVLLLGGSTGNHVNAHEPTIAYLADWKTGKSKYESPFELEVHAVLLHARHPTLTKIVGQYVYLGEDHTSQMYDLNHTSQTWRKIGQIMRQVERDRQSGEFEKRQGPLCSWCPVKDCEYNTASKK